MIFSYTHDGIEFVMIKRASPVLLILLSLLLPTQATSSYLIELKSGASFVTQQYWEEGDQIKCLLYGGTTSFDKFRVKSLSETDLPCPSVEKFEYATKSISLVPQTTAAEPGTEIDSEPEPEQTKAENSPAPASMISDFEKEFYLDKRITIEEEFKAAAEEYREAKSRLKRAEPAEKLKKLRRRNTDLINAVKEQNGGSLPDWWPEGGIASQ